MSGGVKYPFGIMRFLNLVLEGIMENQKKGNAFSIVALVCGLLAVIGAFIPFVTYCAWSLCCCFFVFY